MQTVNIRESALNTALESTFTSSKSSSARSLSRLACELLSELIANMEIELDREDELIASSGSASVGLLALILWGAQFE